MAAPPIVPELYSTVINLMGTTHTFGYIGKHGRTLAPLQAYTVYGDIQDDFRGNRRKRLALDRDIIAGRLRIVNTPAPILRDYTTMGVKRVVLNGGSLGFADPSWGTYTSPV